MTRHAAKTSAPEKGSLLDAALGYARNGWPVLPVNPASKKPLISRWPESATTSTFAIERWWQQWPDANIGIVTGWRSGVVVVDIDPRNIEDQEAVDAFLAAFPSTRRHRTGGGGQHYLFSCTGSVRKFTPLPGVDILGDGGFFVAPPSTHASDSAYVVEDPRPLAALPAAVATQWRPHRPNVNEVVARLEQTLLARGGTRRGDEIRFQCPFHDDENPSAQFNVVKQVFLCFACKTKGRWRRLAVKLRLIDGMPAETRRQLLRLIAAVNHAPMAGRYRTSDRAVLQAHGYIAWRAGGLTYRASMRQVAEQAGMHERTVVAAHRRLRSAGWLTVHPCECTRPNCRHVGTGPGHRLQGTRWTISVPDTVLQKCPSITLQDSSLLDHFRNAGHPAFHPRALGRNGARVLAALDDTPVPAAELARRLQLHRSSVLRVLTKSEAVNAAAGGVGGWTRGSASLDAIAEFFGTRRFAEQSRQRHADERRRYRERFGQPFCAGGTPPLKLIEQPQGGRPGPLCPPTKSSVRGRDESGE